VGALTLMSLLLAWLLLERLERAYIRGITAKQVNAGAGG
jgi:hypothetical protein